MEFSNMTTYTVIYRWLYRTFVQYLVFLIADEKKNKNIPRWTYKRPVIGMGTRSVINIMNNNWIDGKGSRS